MSPLSLNDGPDLEEAAEEVELLKLEEELEQMAQNILEYRTTLPGQLNSNISSLLASQRPVLPTHLLGMENRMLPGPAPDDGDSKGLRRETMTLTVADNREEGEKVQLLKQKISTNAAALPVVLNRMKEYMARFDKLEPSNEIIHPAFKRKRTS